MPEPQLDFFQRLQAVLWPSAGPSAAPATPPTPADSTPPTRLLRGAVAADDVHLEAGVVRVWYVPHDRARRYRLMLRPDGTARCTIPRRGSLKAARRFVDGAREWLAQQLKKRSARPPTSRSWGHGTSVWFRGRSVTLEVETGPDGQPRTARLEQLTITIGGDGTGVSAGEARDGDLRPFVEHALRRLAQQELPPRVHALAEPAGITLKRVTVRNQRTRWGSCSRHGVISLNWRLVQAPEFVRDYIILHELAHRRHLDHSHRFWAEVARLCPEWEAAEAWIKRHGRELM